MSRTLQDGLSRIQPLVPHVDDAIADQRRAQLERQNLRKQLQQAKAAEAPAQEKSLLLQAAEQHGIEPGSAIPMATSYLRKFTERIKAETHTAWWVK